MIKKLLTLVAFATVLHANAQDSTSTPLNISGSVDAYYKYDFSGGKFGSASGFTPGSSNIQTYFANEQNSISLGMIDVMLSKTTGKASFVGEVSFGPRGQGQSLVPSDDGESFHIQNLYASYAFTDKFSVTAGFMGTFVGYEVISPAANFNYSTSYLFGAGPFQNAGIKADYAITDKVGVMVGLFNDWNVYQDFNGVSDFGAQLSVSPVEGWSAYLNFLTGYPSGTIIDLTTAYQITDKFKLGLNAADRSFSNSDDGGYSGIALYPQYGSESASIGLRYEYFKNKDVTIGGVTTDGLSYNTFTLSGNLKAGGLTFIPEIRLDNASENVFYKKQSEFDLGTATTKSATQFSLAVVYAF